MGGGRGRGGSFYPYESTVHKKAHKKAITPSKCSIQFLKIFPYKKKITFTPKLKDKPNEIFKNEPFLQKIAQKLPKLHLYGGGQQ